MRKQMVDRRRMIAFFLAAFLLLGFGGALVAGGGAPEGEVSGPELGKPAIACPPIDPGKFVRPGVLQVSVTTTAPPLDMLDGEGNMVGLYPDLVAQLAKDFNLKVELTRLEWAGMLPGLKAGRFDMGGAGATQTAERKASKDFKLSRPFFASGVTLLLPADSKVETWDDFHGALGGSRGEFQFETAKKLTTPSEIVEFPSRTEGQVALKNRSIDALAIDSAEAYYFVATSPDGDQYKVMEDAVELLPKGTVYRVENTNLIEAFDCAIGVYLEDGTMDRLFEKWYGSNELVELLRKMD